MEGSVNAKKAFNQFATEVLEKLLTYNLKEQNEVVGMLKAGVIESRNTQISKLNEEAAILGKSIEELCNMSG